MTFGISTWTWRLTTRISTIRLTTDSIQLPKEEDFIDMQEFYLTALHEIAHSTGHPKRLNRDLGGGFGTPSYAEEELRAEIASMFINQDLGIESDQSHIENNSAYIDSWKDKIKDNPNVLFMAISEANKIAKFVMSKEHQEELEIEEESSELFMLPSYYVEAKENTTPVDMAGRGIESLTKMSDKDVLDKAIHSKGNEKLLRLYNGENVYGSTLKNETALMKRLAVYCGKDKEQLLRVFKSSGQFKEEALLATYEKMAEESIIFVSKIKSQIKPIIPTNTKANQSDSAKV